MKYMRSTLNKEQQARRAQLKQLGIIQELLWEQYTLMTEALDEDSTEAAIQTVIDVSNLAGKAFRFKQDLYYVNKRLNRAIKDAKLTQIEVS